ncbi:MAG TPA: MxaS protein, partial [Methylococcaceae bacterium]|nr:MxaS protein [Methylococcaceae bacterium]
SSAQSAFESGDNFGFIGCGQGIEKKWLFPKGLRMGRVQELARDLSRVRSGQGGNGLFQVEPYLPL